MELAGERPLTAFGKACGRLGIELIAASSPQAKGRVERSHGVYQDRLVKEIRLQGWSTLAEVNEHLESFDKELNRRFAATSFRLVRLALRITVGAFTTTMGTERRRGTRRGPDNLQSWSLARACLQASS